jgi:uncharacterized membrane protein
MKTFGYFITSVLGIVCTWLGIWLRLSAYDLAWPTEWSYGGPRQDTIWAIREHAYQDISLMILGFGLLLLGIVVSRWLDTSSTR